LANFNAQAGGDVANQIKQLQQESRDAQMKNDASWAQQHLEDGSVAGNSWGDWETKEELAEKETRSKRMPSTVSKIRGTQMCQK